MTPDDAFLAAILEAPDDDAPRLVYADYLDEHGEPDRAAFIRVQCELARLPGDDKRRRDLELRELRLLAEHEGHFLGTLRPWLVRWTFRRGFVESVSVPPQVYLDHADDLRRLAPRCQVEVDVSQVVVSPALFRVIPETMAAVYVVLPLGYREGKLVLASRSSTEMETRHDIESCLQTEIELVAASEGQIIEALQRHQHWTHIR